uniref:Uncharacterized protein n=1 Tax=Arundo donax TaxID=35708 RepID=A0A0A8Y8C4_ARUDO
MLMAFFIKLVVLFQGYAICQHLILDLLLMWIVTDQFMVDFLMDKYLSETYHLHRILLIYFLQKLPMNPLL